jgi:O-methyltransferase involved in polyketide biosynthesis
MIAPRTKTGIGDLSPVERTLLVPLWARAQEALEDDPILLDSRAREILESVDFDFAPLAKARASQVGCCVRGALVDRWARAFLRRSPTGTVVELGCGLNDRFTRVDNGAARAFDLDLPDVISLRRAFFEEAPRRQMLAASVLDEEWIAQLKADSPGPFFFASEGLFVYLQAEEVRSVFRRLARHFPGASLAYDAMTPLVLRHQGHHDAMRHFDARFTWSVSDAAEVEQWDAGIRLTESERFFDLLSAQSKRMPAAVRFLGPCLAALYPPLKRSYTINLVQFA